LTASGQSNITEDQMNDFNESFKHFDKDRSGALDKLEFRACLKTLGQDPNDDAFNKLFSELAAQGGGERITKEAFIKYMISLLEDTDDAHQIKQSFRILSNERPSITPIDLRYPPLQENDVHFLTTHMKGQGEEYDFNEYTDEVFA